VNGEDSVTPSRDGPKPAERGAGSLSPIGASRPVFAFVLVFILLAVGSIVSGYYYYRNYERNHLDEAQSFLATVADLKVSELVQWRRERLGNASIFFQNSNISALLRRFLEKPKDADAQRQLSLWIEKLQKHYEYDRVRLLDSTGVTRLSSPAEPVPVSSVIAQAAAEVLRSGQMAFQDFYRNELDQHIYIAVLVPIFDEANAHRPLGTLILRIDPNRYLYPLIKRWPTSSSTAETLLVRREGNDVVFLNELRFQTNVALKRRESLDHVLMPAVQAALGREGVMEGIDYRGVPVLAALRKIPNSPWVMVSRMDTSEVYAPMKERLWQIILLIGSLLLSALASVGLIWRQQRVRHYREQVETAEALRANEERFRIATEMANDVVYEWDLKQSVQWTVKIDELLGYAPGEFPRTLDGWAASVHPEDSERVMAEVQAHMEGRAPYATEYRVRRRDGAYHWWSARGAVIRTPDGKPVRWIGTITDITQHKKIDADLAIQVRISNIFNTIQDEEMFNEVLKVILDVMNSPFGVFGYLDETGALVVPTMTRQIWDKCQIPEKTIRFPRETWGNSSWPRAIREKQMNYSNKVSTNSPAGHVIVTRHISFPILFHGNVIGLLQVANKETDYTQADIQTLDAIALQIAQPLQARILRERAEQALQESSAQLHHKNMELEHFLYAASHDLKSPVVTVQTFLGYLKKDIAAANTDRIDKDMDYIHAATNKIAQLLDDLLEISRIGHLIGAPVNVTIRTLVDDATGAVGGRIAERGVAIQVNDSDFALHGDRTRLAEIFQNLIDNACKFMGDQKEPYIGIGIAGNNGETAFFVRDNGIGIQPSHQRKVFDLFEKLNPKAEGTGIGLALVRRIVELYGGRIWVESDGLGQGACFYFTLPGAIKQGTQGVAS
jgi:PAS domain S-box-containing protein